MDLADLAGNVSDGVHVASAAGAWMALVFGFGGVRDFEGQLTIDPRLPSRYERLEFRLRFHDRQIRVGLSHTDERYTLVEGEPLEVTIRGAGHLLVPGSPLCLSLRPPHAASADPVKPSP
jgi:alpha,alpha-trehalose phosphorylase